MSTASTIIANIRALGQRNGEVDRRLLNEISSVSTIAATAKTNATNINENISTYTNTVNTLVNNANSAKITAKNLKASAESAGISVITIPTIVSEDKVIPSGNVTINFSAKAVLKNAKVTKFLVKLTNFSNQTIEAANNAGTVTYTIPSGTAINKKLTLEVTAYDSYGNISNPATKTLTVVNSFISTPTITSPLNASVVSLSSGMTVTSSAFDANNSTDTHKSSSWKITEDATGEIVKVSSLNNTTDKTTHTFTSDDLNSLVAGNIYYCHVLHTGNNLGASNWSFPIAILPIVGTQQRGFVLYRSNHNHATTIIYRQPNTDGSMGDLKKIEVADAQFRSGDKAFATTATDSSLNNFNSTNNSSGWYIGGGTADAKTNVLPNGYTNEYLCSMWRNLATDKSAKENCDVWMTYDSTPAVHYCRSLTLDIINGNWNLPNAFQTMVIYTLSDILDQMDPTATLYPALALGTKNTNGRFYFNSTNAWAWTSTEYSTDTARYVRYDGYCYYGDKSLTAGVIPVRELA